MYLNTSNTNVLWGRSEIHGPLDIPKFSLSK